MAFPGFVAQNPVKSALFFLLVLISIVLGAGLVNSVWLMGSLVQVAVLEICLTLAGIALVARLGWWAQAGYTSLCRLADLPLFILPCAFALIPMEEGPGVTAPLTLLGFLVISLLIGFAEETFFRGLILSALMPAGTLRAVIISSLLFAAPHLLNAAAGTWDPAFTIVDTVAAFGLGITFAALRIRTGSIWPLIAIHALFDFTALAALGSVEVHAQSLSVLLSSVAVGIVFIVYGLFLIRGEFLKKSSAPQH